MTPDDSKPIAMAANRKSAKSNRNKAIPVVSVNRSTENNEDLFFNPDDETGHDIEYFPPRRPSRLSTGVSTEDDEPRPGATLPSRSIELPSRSKGKERHKILVPGTPEPDDIEKRPANLSAEERCYQELLKARSEVRATSGT